MISRSHLRVASTGDYIACKGPMSDARLFLPGFRATLKLWAQTESRRRCPEVRFWEDGRDKLFRRSQPEAAVVPRSIKGCHSAEVYLFDSSISGTLERAVPKEVFWYGPI
jgi:hypothetical protein